MFICLTVYASIRFTIIGNSLHIFHIFIICYYVQKRNHIAHYITKMHFYWELGYPHSAIIDPMFYKAIVEHLTI